MGKAENKVASELLRLCKVFDAFAEKVHNEGETGCPDYIVTFSSGRVKRMETKSDCGRLSPKQRWYHRQLEKRHCFVLVPTTPEDVRAIFEIHGYFE